MPDQNRLQSLVDRIPEKWGKTIRFEAGWDPIVIDLDSYLSRLFPNYEIHQMKEKFGTLSFYWKPGEEVSSPFSPNNLLPPFVERLKMDSAIALVNAAGVKSSMTCEKCGEPGRLCKPTRSWMRTLCPGCEKNGL